MGERERLAAATEAADARARAVMESVGEGIVIIDERGLVQEFNPAAEALFGHDAAEVIGRNVKVLMPEPWRSEHDGYLARYLRTGRRRCLGIGFREVEGLRKSGERFPMELSISEMRLGERRYFIGVVRDLSARKAAEAERERLAQALEQTADSIFITDADGVIEYVNPAFEAVTGWRREEVLGARPSMLKSGMHGAGFYRRLWETLLRGEPFRDVFINRRRDGTLFYEEKTITPIKDATGKITHFVSTGRDITERVRTQERLQYLAHHGVLTGLPNRTLFLDRLEQAMARARRHDRTVAVMFMDLDRFKVINDSLGHAVGDALLRELGGRLRAAVREGDTVARFGGDEFAVLLEDMAQPEDVPRVARKLLEALAEPFTVGGRELFLTASIGASLFPADGDDAERLLQHADAAMYQAKAQGRNAFRFYSAELGERSARRLDLETHLRRALEREEFALHYQPQICLRTGRVTGVEALLRWRHPALGEVPPGEFVPVLEDTGLIVPVGRWVMEAACRQLRAWREAGVDGFAVSVNLSAHQLHRPRIAEEILGVLDRTGIDTGSGCLELELTESLLMHEVASFGCCARRGCASPSTTSARATPRSPTSSASPSTCSRSTGPSSPTCTGTRTTAPSCGRSSRSAAAWACRWWLRGWRPASSSSSSAGRGAMPCRAISSAHRCRRRRCRGSSRPPACRRSPSSVVGAASSQIPPPHPWARLPATALAPSPSPSSVGAVSQPRLLTLPVGAASSRALGPAGSRPHRDRVPGPAGCRPCRDRAPWGRRGSSAPARRPLESGKGRGPGGGRARAAARARPRRPRPRRRPHHRRRTRAPACPAGVNLGWQTGAA